jgi:hypothetical protein
MKKYLLGTLVAVTCLFALAARVQAEEGDVVVHITQDFLAGGKMLPAGTYAVHRTLPETGQALMLRGEESGESAFLVIATHDASLPDRPHVKLTQVEEVYYLSEVATELGVYTLPAPRELTRIAKAKGHQTTATAGGN